MTPDPMGALIGLFSIGAICALYRYADVLGDGNIGGELSPTHANKHGAQWAYQLTIDEIERAKRWQHTSHTTKHVTLLLSCFQRQRQTH